MPIACRKPCAHPGCGTLTNSTYCEKHRLAHTWNHGGKSRQERGYGRAWEKLREHVLLRDMRLCQECLRKESMVTLATEVDHILPKSQGGTDDLDNLQSLCHRCHSKKTALNR